MEDQMVTVGNLMQTEPVTVEVGTSVVEAAKLMRASRVESVLVTYLVSRLRNLLKKSSI
jgi:CBS domain-containing protein